jgi:hypothetical protein
MALGRGMEKKFVVISELGYRIWRSSTPTSTSREASFQETQSTMIIGSYLPTLYVLYLLPLVLTWRPFSILLPPISCQPWS